MIKVSEFDLLQAIVEAVNNNKKVFIFNDGSVVVNNCSASTLESHGHEVIKELEFNCDYEEYDIDDADYTLDTLKENDELEGIELI